MENEINIQARPYRKGDEPYLSAILNKIYHQAFNDEYWWWKYLNNPLGAHFCYCAVMENRIVGFAGSIPYRIKYKDREIIAAQITDLAVEPDLQGKKVFSPIQKAKLADIKANTDAFYGFTNENSFRVYRNFDFAFRVPRMTRILKTAALLNERLPSAAARPAGALADFGLNLAERVKCAGRKAGLGIREIKALDDRFDAFLKQVSPSFKIMHVRDTAYLNWRYLRHPIYRYTFLAVEEADAIAGFAVLRDDPGDVHRGLILEFLTAPEREDIQHLLLEKIIAYFRERGVAVIVCWMFPHAPYYKTFKRHMFVDRRGDLIVLTSPSREDEELRTDLRNPLNWYISCGDDESF
jgi:GNAT superfamily N-acetyltransferase